MAWYKEIAPHIEVEQNIFDNNELVSYRMTPEDKKYWEERGYSNPKVYLLRRSTTEYDKNNHKTIFQSFVLSIGNGDGSKTVAVEKKDASNVEFIEVTDIFRFKTAQAIRKRLYQIINQYTEVAKDTDEIFKLIKKDSNNYKGYYAPIYYSLLVLGKDYPQTQSSIKNWLKQYEEDINWKLEIEISQKVGFKKMSLKDYQQNPNWYALLSKQEIKKIDKFTRKQEHDIYPEKWSIDSNLDVSEPYKKMVDSICETVIKVADELNLSNELINDFEDKFKKQFDKEFSKTDDTLINALCNYRDENNSDEIKMYLSSRKFLKKDDKLSKIYSVGTLNSSEAQKIDNILFKERASELLNNLNASKEQLILKINPEKVLGGSLASTGDLIFYFDDLKKVVSKTAETLEKEGLYILEAPQFLIDNQVIKMENAELMLVKNDNALKDDLNQTYLQNYQSKGKIELDKLINQCILKHAKKFTIHQFCEYIDVSEAELTKDFRKSWESDETLRLMRQDYLEDEK